jgi:hypothetical protein
MSGKGRLDSFNRRRPNVWCRALGRHPDAWRQWPLGTTLAEHRSTPEVLHSFISVFHHFCTA